MWLRGGGVRRVLVRCAPGCPEASGALDCSPGSCAHGRSALCRWHAAAAPALSISPRGWQRNCRVGALLPQERPCDDGGARRHALRSGANTFSPLPATARSDRVSDHKPSKFWNFSAEGARHAAVTVPRGDRLAGASSNSVIIPATAAGFVTTVALCLQGCCHRHRSCSGNRGSGACTSLLTDTGDDRLATALRRSAAGLTTATVRSRSSRGSALVSLVPLVAGTIAGSWILENLPGHLDGPG